MAMNEQRGLPAAAGWTLVALPAVPLFTRALQPAANAAGAACAAYAAFTSIVILVYVLDLAMAASPDDTREPLLGRERGRPTWSLPARVWATLLAWGLLCLVLSFTPALVSVSLPALVLGAAVLGFVVSPGGNRRIRSLFQPRASPSASPRWRGARLIGRDSGSDDAGAGLRAAEEGRAAFRRPPPARASPSSASRRPPRPAPHPPPAPHRPPAPRPPEASGCTIRSLDDAVLEAVFVRLPPLARCAAAQVCRDWLRILDEPRFWTFEAAGLRLSPAELDVGSAFDIASMRELPDLLRLGRYGRLRSVRLAATSCSLNARLLSSVCAAVCAAKSGPGPKLSALRASLPSAGGPLLEAAGLGRRLRLLALKTAAGADSDGEDGSGSSGSDEGPLAPPVAPSSGLEALLLACSEGFLEVLDLKGYEITAAALDGLSGLRALRLRRCAVREEALSGLVGRCPRLAHLALARPRPPLPRHRWAERLARPAPLRSLWLDLPRDPADSAALCAALAERCPGLSSVRLAAPRPPPWAFRPPPSPRLPEPGLPPSALAALAAAPLAQLTALALDCAPTSEGGPLGELLGRLGPHLRALAISSDALTPALLARAAAACPALTALAVEDAPLPAAALAALAPLASLTTLSLARCPLGPLLARDLPALPALAFASFLRCPGVTRADAPAVRAAWPRLQKLALDDVHPHEYMDALAAGYRPLPVSSLFLGCSVQRAIKAAAAEGEFEDFSD